MFKNNSRLSLTLLAAADCAILQRLSHHTTIMGLTRNLAISYALTSCVLTCCWVPGQSWRGSRSRPMLEQVDGAPCQLGLLDGPAALARAIMTPEAMPHLQASLCSLCVCTQGLLHICTAYMQPWTAVNR